MRENSQERDEKGLIVRKLSLAQALDKPGETLQVALVHGTTYPGMQAETMWIDT